MTFKEETPDKNHRGHPRQLNLTQFYSEINGEPWFVWKGSQHASCHFHSGNNSARNGLKKPEARCAKNMLDHLRTVFWMAQMQCSRKHLHKNSTFQLLAFWILFFSLTPFRGFTGQTVLLRNIFKKHPCRECGNIPKERKIKASSLWLRLVGQV